MGQLTRRLERLEAQAARRGLPDDPRDFRIDDYIAWKASLTPDELAALQARVKRELREFYEQLNAQT